MTKADVDQLDAEIDRLRLLAQSTPEALAWYSRRLDKLELLQAERETAPGHPGTD
jgi:hypothetical protein